MAIRTKTICPENTELAAPPICHELDLKDVLSKSRNTCSHFHENVWLELNGITQADFTAEFEYNLHNDEKAQGIAIHERQPRIEFGFSCSHCR